MEQVLARRDENRIEDLEHRQTMWWYLLIGPLSFLATETVLSNRLSRRALDPDGQPYLPGMRIIAVAVAAFWAASAADAVAQDGASDRQALEALYDVTGGPTWTRNTNWKTTAPLGQWHGVTTDADGRVTGLDLSENALSGSIPPELGSLSRLVELSLGGNALTGRVPAWLASLSDLEVLSLWGNELNGLVPGGLGGLARLRRLTLSRNDLTGPIPPELGNLARLEWLSLSENDLTGPIPPELGNLARLERLFLFRNDLTGPIPPGLGNLARLERLSLSRNDLEGSMPDELGALMNLERLYLGYNWGLSGPLPPGLRSQTIERLGAFATRTCAPVAWRDWLETIAFSGRLCETGTDVTIDVAVVYTPAARLAAGDAAAIEAEIDLAVAETNQAYQASWVHHRIALVEMSEVSYIETGDSTVDLRRLLNSSDGHLDEVHALRDEVGADLVHLIVDNDDVGGRAYIHGAFGLSAQGAGGHVVAHELGHNMGLRHDRYRDRHDEIRLFPHPAYGYVNQRALVPGGSAPSSLWRTIMSDPAQCAYWALDCRWLLRFSNPRQTWFHDPLGVAYGVGESEVTGPADASAVLNVTGPAVALWRRRPSNDANRPPAVVGALPDQILPVPHRMLAVDVSMAFADPDGDALTYTVSSSAPQVVTALVAGARVKLTAVGAGTATIQVLATDPGGLSAAQSFTVTVTPPANRPPKAVGRLAPLTIGVDESPVTVEVGGAFRDPDGDALSYGAMSSSPGVASVAVVGSTVTVTPTGEGTATVTVTATDAGGSNGTATQTFMATVRPAGARRFTDDPIVPGVTPVRAVHFTELRSRIDALRAGTGLGRFAWSDPVLRAGVTPVRGLHLLELRQALAEAYAAAGRAVPRWTNASPNRGRPPIRALHLTELRVAVLALE